MRSLLFVPGDSTAKLGKGLGAGADALILDLEDSVALERKGEAQKVAEKLDFYLAGDYAFRVEGSKTGAFELIDQLFFQVPDAVIVPMGCGTNMASYVKGFREYQQLGFIEGLL